MMQIKLIIIGAILILNISCSAQSSPIGVWMNEEAFLAWEADPADELLGGKELDIDGSKYLYLTNSVIIEKDQLVVPGGVWRIEGIERKSRDSFVLRLQSSVSDYARIEIDLLDPNYDTAVFRLIQSGDSIRKEIESSFLLFGEKYRRRSLQ